MKAINLAMSTASHALTRQWWELDGTNDSQGGLVSCGQSCKPHIVVEVARKSRYCLCLEDPTSHLSNTLPWHVSWWQLPKCVYGLLCAINVVEVRDNSLWPPVKDPYNESAVSVTISAAFVTTVVFTHSTKTKSRGIRNVDPWPEVREGGVQWEVLKKICTFSKTAFIFLNNSL